MGEPTKSYPGLVAKVYHRDAPEVGHGGITEGVDLEVAARLAKVGRIAAE